MGASPAATRRDRWRQFWRLLGGIAAIAALSFSLCIPPAIASELEPLTPERLAERLATTRAASGLQTLDFSHLRIDLADTESRDRFYRELRARLERSPQPLALDFSDATIQGELDLTQLAQSVPLVEEALAAVLTPSERDRLPADLQQLRPSAAATLGVSSVKLLRCALKLDRTRLLGGLRASDLVFLQSVQATGAIARGPLAWERAYLAREWQWSEATFSAAVNLSGSQFASAVQATNSKFQAATDWSGANFAAGGNFSGSRFAELGDGQRSQWHDTANFARTHWSNRLLLSKSRFLAALDLSGATFEQAVALRAARFNAPVRLTEVSLLNQIDFSDVVFAQGAAIAVDGLAFDSDQARVLGDKGQIGAALHFSSFAGNQTAFRNLIRNFRRLEQISDANRLEYAMQRLHLQQLGEQLSGTPRDWHFLGRRWRSLLLWAGLSALLLLSNYGTNAYLVLSCGSVALASFSLLVWVLDRWRRPPSQIRPTRAETAWMLGSASLLLLLSVAAIAQTSAQPTLTLLCLSLLVLPLPVLLAVKFYRQGSDRDQPDKPYLLENGSERQWGLAIVRLPIVPKFPFYRDRYTAIPWGRRWNWLNYYGFSLNTFLKISFNDLRLRDEQLPSAVSAIAWYQWSLGLLYSVLLLWTLSRSIPGLNLLIYLR